MKMTEAGYRMLRWYREQGDALRGMRGIKAQVLAAMANINVRWVYLWLEDNDPEDIQELPLLAERLVKERQEQEKKDEESA